MAESTRATKIVAVLAATLLLTAVACTKQQTQQTQPATPAGTPAQTENSSRLFVIVSDGGTSQAAGTDTVEITLTGVATSVTTFSDRPSRDAATESIATFVDAWPGRFGNEPPNAALVTQGGAADAGVATIALRPPTYDPASGRLAFAARLLPRSGGTSQIAIPASFGRAQLFVDTSAGASPLSQEVSAWPSNPVSVIAKNIPAGPGPSITIEGSGGYPAWVLTRARYSDGNQAGPPGADIAVYQNALFFSAAGVIDSAQFDMAICSDVATVEVVAKGIRTGASITMDAGAGSIEITQDGNYSLKIANPKDCGPWPNQ